MPVDNVKVKMLGGFSVWVNDELIVDNVAKPTKPWQLFCYLALHRENFVPSEQLISALWVDDDLADPANVLKNTVYSLRKELCGGESSTESPIIYASGGYRFDPNVPLQLDTEDFSNLSQEARTAPSDTDVKLNLCRDAVAAYTGDFLPQLDQELWVVPISLQYRKEYLRCVHDLAEMLWLRREYRELLDIVTTATMFEPLDDISVVYTFRALDALRMYRMVVTTYAQVVQDFEDALGREPPMEVQRIYEAASDRIQKTEQDIIVVKTEMIGVADTIRPSRGAYYCSYSDLKRICSILYRSAERNDQALVLALFTLSPGDGVEPTQHDMARAMAEFRVVAMNTLRRSDAFARYSRNQYVMLLTVQSLDNGCVVRDRIKESYFNATNQQKTDIDVKMTEI